MKRAPPSEENILRFSGDRIRERRLDAGMSQAELGEFAGFSPDAVGRIERGSGDCSILSVSALYIHLGFAGVSVAPEGIVPLREEDCGLSLHPDTRAIRPPSMLCAMGMAVRERREAYGFSLGALAAEAGVHPNTVWNFERGLVVPGICTYFRLLRRLGVATVTVREGRALFLGE
jgi:transcriptional regulator with XRE-family HTH domain